MEKKIKLARYRSIPYVVNYSGSGSEKRYEWMGAKGNKIDIKEVPVEMVEWLSLQTICLEKGELVVIEDSEEAKEVLEGVDKENYKNNTHTEEEILKLLSGNFMKMKTELGKISVDSERKFVLTVAKSIKEDLTTGKVKFLADWAGIPQEVLFADDSE
jgi:hypothetical protein